MVDLLLRVALVALWMAMETKAYSCFEGDCSAGKYCSNIYCVDCRTKVPTLHRKALAA